MWLGIIAVCLSNLVFLFFSLGSTIVFSDFCFWFIWMFGIALITGGLIVTFKDKKPKDEQKQ
jgi:hypothetical protein